MDTKHKIIRVSFELFLEKGFSEVSTNDIIREAGITKGGFYHYFKSKEDLIAEVIEKFICPFFKTPIDYITEKLKKEKFGDIKEKLKYCYTTIPEIEAGEEFGEIGIVDFRNFHLLMFEGMKKYEYLAKIRCDYSRRRRKLIEDILEEGKREGIISKQVDSKAYATTMSALRDGMISLSILDESIDAKEKCQLTFEQIWNEIKAVSCERGGV